MPDKKKISELDSASVLNNGDLVVISQDNGDDSYSSKKAVLTMLGTKLLNGIDYTTLLDTTSKKPIGAINELRDLIIGQLPVVTESGSLVTFTTPLALPLVSLKANITAQQAGTGTPSPQNIRSISGFSEINVANSADTNKATCFKGLTEGTYGVIDLGSLTWSYITDSDFTNGGFFRASLSSLKTNTVSISATEYESAGVLGKAQIISKYGAGANNLIYTAPDTTRVYILDSNYTDATAFKTHLQTDNVYFVYELATPTTPTITPEQYRTLCQAFGIDTFTISLGDTYYGGVLDCKNGTATITHGFADLSTLSWTYSSNQNGWYTDDIKNDGIFQYNNVTWMSDIWNPHVWTGRAEGDMVCNSSKTLFCLTSDTVNTPTGVIVYELATPITLSGLTPDNFTAFAGENNIFADSGDVELSFRQGIQEYIDEQIASVQALVL